MQRARRQDPVSCELCRTKKLKCDRGQPCSNCSARGVACRGTSRPAPREPSNLQGTDVSQIFHRLQRLEAIVLPSEKVKPISLEDRPSKRLALTPNSDDGPFPRSYEALPPENEIPQDTDALMLDNVATRDDTILVSLSHDLKMCVESTSEILAKYSAHHSSLHRGTIPFPEYEEAVQLFCIYETDVDHCIQITHNPTIRTMMKCLYTGLAEGNDIELGEAALLLGIFSMCVFFSEPYPYYFLPRDDEGRLRLCKVWARAALDLLDQSRRTTSGSLEDVQALLVMSFMVFHLDGFSARGRSLFASAVNIGRDIRLHRVDEDGAVPDHELSSKALIDREIKRRMWWHLASTDWYVSFACSDSIYPF